MSIISCCKTCINGIIHIALDVATQCVGTLYTPKRNGVRAAEIKRMASAFEHDDLAKAFAL